MSVQATLLNTWFRRIWLSLLVAFGLVGFDTEAVSAASELLPAECQAKAAQLVDTGTIGVVLLHGKRGMPRGHIKDLTAYLEDQGFKVAAPEMPWSKEQNFDRSFEDAMTEIDGDVERLRAKGAKKIIVGGHSQGGTGALGYGATRSGLAGVMVLAGGGDPGKIYGAKSEIRDSVEEARELVSSDRGDQERTFKDLSLGRMKKLRTSASIYLSYFDPKGPALMPDNAAALKVPLLWVFGRDDKLRKVNSPDYAFEKAPGNPLSAYALIDAGHRNTPGKGRELVAKWLKCLGK